MLCNYTGRKGKDQTAVEGLSERHFVCPYLLLASGKAGRQGFTHKAHASEM